MRRAFLAFSVALFTTILPAANKEKFDREVKQITRSAILIDTHNDIPSFTVDGVDIGNSPNTHTDIQRLRSGGVGAVFFSVYVGSLYVNGNHSANRALKMIDTVHHDIVDRYPDTFRLATTAEDIERAHKQHKIAALMGLEGGHAIEDSPRLLRDYYRLGIRYMTLTHTNTNHWADSSGDSDDATVEHHNGLTPLGKEIVREMNRLGMMVDISHVADKTFYDALEVSRAPLIASHSDCRAISNVPRNMTDDMIIALAKKGGVIQLSVNCSFVSQKSADANASSPMPPKYAEARKRYQDDPVRLQKELDALEQEDKRYQVRATLADVIANIDHVKKIAGIDAIGIGTDFDGIICTPAGFDDVSKFPDLTRALLEHGYTPTEIKKIYGGNTLRLMRAVEQVAKANRSVD